MNEILLSLSGASNVAIQNETVVGNIASTRTDTEDMDKYSSASLLSIGNRLECCWQNANGSVQWRRNRGFRRFNEPGPPSSE